MEKKLLNEMFDSLLHIGNKTNYWNPKMKDYIYGSVNGVHVINLTETAKKVLEVKAELSKLASEGKKILFVATKLQTRDIFEKLAKETGHFYVTEKWVPGLLTNFKTIKLRIATYIQLLKDSESGSLDVLTKKEKATKLLELDKLDKAFKGVKEMKKAPEVVFVVDGVYEKQAVKEAKSLNLVSFGILNTNGDETLFTNMIPANTNSVKSLEFLASTIQDCLSNIKVVNATSVKKMTPKAAPTVKKEVKAAPKKEAAPTEEK